MRFFRSHNIVNHNNLNRACLVTALALLLLPFCAGAQKAMGDATVTARVDARQITVGDQVRLFLEVGNLPSGFTLQWPAIPDSFNSLEVVERGKIDTVKQGDKVVAYKQRLLITGFDSGMFQIPSFSFAFQGQGGEGFSKTSDSFQVLVQTVAVDTSKGFRGIKGIIYVKSSWLDYLWWILGGLALIGLTIFLVIYLTRNKQAAPKPQGPVESLQDYTLRLLNELDKRQLWQKKQVKDYYVELTDIVRNYIEKRFSTSALELTTDEMLSKVQMHREMTPYYDLLSQILTTADLAKFAKFQPSPQEHMDTLDRAREFVETSRPAPQPATDPNQPVHPNPNTNS